jgi:serine/threonine protein kinase
VKRYLSKNQFQRELELYQLPSKHADSDWSHFPRLLGFDDDSLTISIRPLAESTLHECSFSPELFRAVIIAGLKVLPRLHECGYIHGDISPHNILVSQKSNSEFYVTINDFSCQHKVGYLCTQFFGTPGYTSRAMCRVSIQQFEYKGPHDWQMFVFTLLGFCHPNRKLPWFQNEDRDPVSDQIAHLDDFDHFCKVFFSPSFEAEVGEVTALMLQSLLKALYVNNCTSETAIKILTEYLDMDSKSCTCFRQVSMSRFVVNFN